jgi:hypothetical protein
MKLKAVAVALGLCAAGLLLLPDSASAYRGGYRGGGRRPFPSLRIWDGCPA